LINETTGLEEATENISNEIKHSSVSRILVNGSRNLKSGVKPAITEKPKAFS